MSGVAPFKTEGILNFWISGFQIPVTGKIADVEFVHNEESVETFLIIESGTKKLRVSLDEVKIWGIETQKAA